MDIVRRLQEEIGKDLIDKMFDLIIDLDSDQLTEEQAENISNIIDMLDPPELNEVFRKKVRRDITAAKKRRREYQRHKAARRLKARKYRRSSAGKRTLRKAKRFAKVGRTSTGKRIKTFIGPALPKIQRRKPMRMY